MDRLTVLYDDECPFCVRAAEWLAGSDRLVDLELLPARSPEAIGRYGSIPWLGAELVVADDSGNVWAGPAAFLVCLWATRRWRGVADAVVSSDWLAALAMWCFDALSKHRGEIGSLLGLPRCECGLCGVPARTAPYR